MREIHRRTTLLCFFIERLIDFDIVADIGNRHQQAPAVGLLAAAADDGGFAIDGVVEVARVFAVYGAQRHVGQVDAAALQAGIAANMATPIALVQRVIDGMTSRGWGRIVNIGSINGQAGQFGQVNYSAAKSALHGFTKALAQETARYGVTVNTVAPGYIATDMVAAVPEEQLVKIIAKIPVGRLGEAHEIARMVDFLCAEESGFITGSTISANGGQFFV